MCFSLAQREALQGRDRVSLLAKPGEQALNVLIAHGREGSEFAQPVPRKLIHLLHEEGSSIPEPSAYLLRQRPTTERGPEACIGEGKQSSWRQSEHMRAVAANRGALTAAPGPWAPNPVLPPPHGDTVLESVSEWNE